MPRRFRPNVACATWGICKGRGMKANQGRNRPLDGIQGQMKKGIGSFSEVFRVSQC